MGRSMVVVVVAAAVLMAGCGGDDDTATTEEESTPIAAEPTSTPEPASDPTPTVAPTASPTAEPPTPEPTAEPTEPAGEDQNRLEVRAEVLAGTSGARPETGTAIVAWVVFTGRADYTYLYGQGRQAADELVIQLDEAPPTEALNNGSLGVGIVLLTPEATDVPEGRIDLEEESLELAGAAGRYAIIYRTQEPLLPWAVDFPVGYSCGRGVDARANEDFDTFEPIDCDQLVLEIADLETIDFVNWT